VTGNDQPSAAEVDAFILEFVEAGLVEIVGVDERGRVVYRGTRKPFPAQWPSPGRPRASS
jgi:hypothetical protein